MNDIQVGWYNAGVQTEIVNPPNALEADSVPIPPRFWWLKRILIASVGLLVALVVLRLWWGWYADRQLQAEIDRIIAAGEPIYPEDFDAKEQIPDDQNAAWYYRQAGSKLKLTSAQSELIDKVSWVDATVQTKEMIRAILASNDEALRLWRAGTTKENVDWQFRLRSPVINAIFPDYSDQRSLGKLVVSEIVLYRQGRDHKSAIATISGLLKQADDIGEQPMLLPHLVSISLMALACYQVEALSPVIQLRSGEDDPPTFAPREEVTQLIGSLLQPKADAALHRAILSERMFQYDICRSVIQGTLNAKWVATSAGTMMASLFDRAKNWPVGPLYDSDTSWILKTMNSLIRASGMGSFVLAKKHLPTELDYRNWDNWDETLHPLGAIVFPSLDRSSLLHFRSRALRKMAAIALATRLYELDHGARPVNLSDLVPGYLTEIPDDPFGPVGKKIGYLPNANPPILYSCNHDGIDNEGQYGLRKDGSINMEEFDLPFFLNGDRPGSKPQKAQQDSKDAGDDEGDVENQEREDADGEGEKENP